MSEPRGHPTSRRSSSTSVEQRRFLDRLNFAERTAALSAPAHRLHQVILHAFLQDGCAPRLADLRPVARASGIGLEHLLAELAVHDVIQRTADGAIQVAYPFSGSPTAHRVQLEDGPTVFAMCVIDALGLPFMARRAATIRTQDPFDATLITIAIGCGPTGKPVSSQVHWLPASAVVLVNKPPTGPVIQAECTCPYLNAFASRETAQRWRAAHADLDVQMLTQQRAVREARRIFGAVLQESAAADAWAITEQRPSPVPKHQPAGRREEY